MINEKLLAKFLMDECTENELCEIKRWMDESNEHAFELFTIEELYQLGKTGFSTRATDVDRAEQMLFKRLKNGRKRKSESWILSSWMRYAATFVGIILLSGTIYLTFLKYNTEKESLLTVNTRNEVEQLTLPDGTKVWLNKNSIFRYPKEFDENNREVHLEGEGYFEVQKNPEKPFIVHVDDINVKVLGTVFNVRSYPEDSEIEVSLIKGKVNVFSASETRDNVILAPDEQLTYDKRSGKMNHHHVDALQTSQWTTGRLSFVNASVPEIMKAIERKYDVRIVIHSKYLDKEVFSGSISPKLTVEEILDYMDVDNKYSWSRSGNVITITDKLIK